MLKKLEEQIKILTSKAKFVDLVVNKKIDLFNKTKEQIITILDSNKLLKKLSKPVPGVFHGTYKKHLDSIKATSTFKKPEVNDDEDTGRVTADVQSAKLKQLLGSIKSNL